MGVRPVSSMLTMCSRPGSWSRTASIFSSCAASSTTIARAPECSTTYWHSPGEFVW